MDIKDIKDQLRSEMAEVQEFGKQKPVYLVYIIIGLLLLVAVAGFYYFSYNRSSVKDTASTASSKEIGNLRFISGADERHLDLSKLDGNGEVSTIKYPDLTFVEVASASKLLYAVLKDSAGKEDIYSIPDHGDPIALTHDGRTKRSIAISPDNSTIAFSYVNDLPKNFVLPKGATKDQVFIPSRFTLAILNVKSGKVVEGGNGIYPHFIDAGTLFYISQKGYMLKNLSTNKTELSASSVLERMFRAPVFLDSGKFVYYDPIANKSYYMQIAHEGGQLAVNTLSISRVLTNNIRSTASDGAGKLYGLFGSPEGSVKLVRISEDKSSSLLDLPESLHPRDVLYVQ